MARVNGILLGLLYSSLGFVHRAHAACKGSSGSSYASCCHSSWTEYAKSKNAYESPTPTYVDWVWDYVLESDTNVPFTTLCDGFPRAMKPYGSTTFYSTKSTPTPTTWDTIWLSKEYTSPKPTCSINVDDCIPYAKSWDAVFSSWSANQSLPYPTETRICSTYIPCPTGGTDTQVCKLYAEEATVYYWPATTTGDFCGVRTTLPPAPTPKSTVMGGTTFVSPTAYMKIKAVSAERHVGKYTHSNCGYERKDIFMTFPNVKQISTHWYKPGTASHTLPLDVGDLNTPFPASAYFTKDRPKSCTVTPCPTIGGDYTPGVLEIPMQLSKVDPEWAYCTPRSEGFEEATFIPLEPNPPNWPKPTTPPKSTKTYYG